MIMMATIFALGSPYQTFLPNDSEWFSKFRKEWLAFKSLDTNCCEFHPVVEIVLAASVSSLELWFHLHRRNATAKELQTLHDVIRNCRCHTHRLNRLYQMVVYTYLREKKRVYRGDDGMGEEQLPGVGSEACEVKKTLKVAAKLFGSSKTHLIHSGEKDHFLTHFAFFRLLRGMYRVSLDTEVSERSNVTFAKDPHDQSNKVGQTLSDVMLMNMIRKDHANALAFRTTSKGVVLGKEKQHPRFNVIRTFHRVQVEVVVVGREQSGRPIVKLQLKATKKRKTIPGQSLYLAPSVSFQTVLRLFNERVGQCPECSPELKIISEAFSVVTRVSERYVVSFVDGVRMEGAKTYNEGIVRCSPGMGLQSILLMRTTYVQVMGIVTIVEQIDEDEQKLCVYFIVIQLQQVEDVPGLLPFDCVEYATEVVEGDDRPRYCLRVIKAEEIDEPVCCVPVDIRCWGKKFDPFAYNMPMYCISPHRVSHPSRSYEGSVVTKNHLNGFKCFWSHGDMDFVAENLERDMDNFAELQVVNSGLTEKSVSGKAPRQPRKRNRRKNDSDEESDSDQDVVSEEEK